MKKMVFAFIFLAMLSKDIVASEKVSKPYDRNTSESEAQAQGERLGQSFAVGAIVGAIPPFLLSALVLGPLFYLVAQPSNLSGDEKARERKKMYSFFGGLATGIAAQIALYAGIAKSTQWLLKNNW